jgi:hypothetical protein
MRTQQIFIAALFLLQASVVKPAYSASVIEFVQQGPKLVGSGYVGTSPLQGKSVAISSDGNTAIFGGPGDINPVTGARVGAAWVFVRSNGVWTQQGNKLVGTGAPGDAGEGTSVALSADGNTAIIGGPADDAGTGAAWIFVRNNGVWSQQGPKLVGTGASGMAMQGQSVSLSGDGNTAIVGGPNDPGTPPFGTSGAAWIFARSNGVWTQQGSKLAGPLCPAPPRSTCGGSLGLALALSGDGSTAIAGGSNEWVFFANNGGVWTQQAAFGGVFSVMGASVALSGDGNTALVGSGGSSSFSPGYRLPNFYYRSNGVWSSGETLNGNGNLGFGASLSLSADGTRVLVGDEEDAGAWVFNRVNGTWTQMGVELAGVSGQTGPTSVALSGDGTTAIVGNLEDNGSVGAVWLFVSSSRTKYATATHDFNGDGFSDLLWRNQNSFEVVDWLMNGAQVSQLYGFGQIPSEWSIVGQRDFDGDGSADLLWRDTSGNVAIWEMNGSTVLNGNSSFVGSVATNWSIVGTGDFNGDSKADILWQDTLGDVAIWEMNGTAILNQNSSFVANVAGQWSIKGTGDFNGDGKTDILWQDTSGNVAIWEMNGTSILNQNGSFVANVAGQWLIKGTGDFNGDGMSDILWEDTFGNVAIWEMNGTAVLNQDSSFVANVSSQWSIQLTGDFNGDGMSDILWQDTSGNVAI